MASWSFTGWHRACLPHTTFLQGSDRCCAWSHTHCLLGSPVHPGEHRHSKPPGISLHRLFCPQGFNVHLSAAPEIKNNFYCLFFLNNNINRNRYIYVYIIMNTWINERCTWKDMCISLLSEIYKLNVKMCDKFVLSKKNI